MAYTALEVAMGVRRLFDSPDNWTKGAMAMVPIKGAEGKRMQGAEPDDVLASCFCLDGAVLKILWDIGGVVPDTAQDDMVYEIVIRALEDAIDLREPPVEDNDSRVNYSTREAIWNFNDASGTAYEDILWVVDHAVKSLEMAA
jgi:hypothetical protein